MVKKKNLLILWDRKAKEHIDEIYEYIAKDSTDAAIYVKKKLVELAHSLNDFPEKYSKEEYLADEPEDYRSVSKWSYKIIFEITDEYLIIADIFHTGQHPSKILRHKQK